MAVKHVETFTFELPLAVVEVRDHGWGEVPADDAIVDVTMDRAGLNRLYLDLAEALGNDRPMPSQPGHDMVIRQEYPAPEEAIFTEPHPGTERLSVEAAAQAMARMEETRQQHLANPNQPRGSAIGNRHT